MRLRTKETNLRCIDSGGANDGKGMLNGSHDELIVGRWWPMCGCGTSAEVVRRGVTLGTPLARYAHVSIRRAHHRPRR